MCGIAGILNLSYKPLREPDIELKRMNQIQAHRGPDAEGVWLHPHGHVGFGHRRLSIIDLETGNQPMSAPNGNCITYNGEIYNYVELRNELGAETFTTTSDTEVILRAYEKWGEDCVTRFRGMFAFAIWDEARRSLFCARDHFGIKPFYYSVVGNAIYIASEAKALLPFLDEVDTDPDALKDYLAFQFCLGKKSLFKNVSQLLPGHTLAVRNGAIQTRRYWEVYYDIDNLHKREYFVDELRSRLLDSVNMHLRSDVAVGSYLSGGLDSSTVAALAAARSDEALLAFNGRFDMGSRYDETAYARLAARNADMELHEKTITVDDFVTNMSRIIRHLDYPVAGPGSFPQFMVSELAAQHRKVVLGGQGGDEIFGGYARYLIAYFEQCIKAAIDGTMHNGNFVVTYESIIPNLVSLRNYKPMLKEFWKDGLFDDMDRRYFRLINRTPDSGNEINWNELNDYSPFETFQQIFNGANVRQECYFDLMTHFDFKTLLPALLHVEDRVSMAHGLESRVPLLDLSLVELAATISADIKFKAGEMKHVFKEVVQPFVPPEIHNRRDKMGFPTPLTEWVRSDARDFVHDILSSSQALSRRFVNNRKVLELLDTEAPFSRRLWGFLCLELWQREFHDREQEANKPEGMQRNT